MNFIALLLTFAMDSDDIKLFKEHSAKLVLIITKTMNSSDSKYISGEDLKYLNSVRRCLLRLDKSPLLQEKTTGPSKEKRKALLLTTPVDPIPPQRSTSMETLQQNPSNELSTVSGDSSESITKAIKLVLESNGEIVPKEKKGKKKKKTSPEYDSLTLKGIRVENFLLTGDDVPIFPIGLTETKKS